MLQKREKQRLAARGRVAVYAMRVPRVGVECGALFLCVREESMSEALHFDLLVLGGGSGGVAMARRSAEYGARVALVEAARLGGTCVNVGCVPKKLMWFAAERAHALETAAEFGFTVDGVRFDWSALVAGRDAFVARLNGIYAQMLETAGVTVFRGAGRFCAPRTIEVGGQRLCGEHVVIATGGQAVIPPVPGAELGMSSDGFFALREQPRRAVVAGSGYIAVELAGVLRALGSEVDLLVRSDRLLRPFDALVRETVAERLTQQGVRIHWRTQAQNVARADDGALAVTLTDQSTLTADALLWAVGREPNTAHLNLAAAGVNTRANGEIEVDEFQNTSAPNTYAIGDITGQPELTPVAIACGRALAARLFLQQAGARWAARVVPTVIFTHPPAASAGLSEEAARARFGDAAVQVFTSRFNPMVQALAAEKRQTVMKLVCAGENQTVVGCHIVGEGADEMLQGFAVALEMGATKADFDRTLAIHPTSAEELVTMR